MDAYIWFALMLVFLVIEALCPVHLVSIWFAAGAFVAAMTGLWHGQLWLQVVLFFVVSIACLIALFPVARRFNNANVRKTNLDSVIGSQGYVIENIDNMNAVGRVKLGGMEWAARSSDGVNIPAGTLVKVDRIEGVKVYVTAGEVTVP